MFYQTEFCNLQNDEEAKFFTDLINTCTRNSDYGLSEGSYSDEFIDLDMWMIDPNKSDILVDKICSVLTKLILNGDEFEKLAFIEKTDGTVGLITLLSSISNKLNKKCIIVRPKKKLINDIIKGELLKGDRVVIISDLATSGRTIFNAAEKVWVAGGKVPYSLVVIDKLLGGYENLARKGIRLYSLSSTQSINNTLGQKIKRNLRVAAPVFSDFGGQSITLAR